MLGALIRKEFTLDWRQKHGIAGLILYVLATSFTCYLALERVEASKVWNALVWITAVFTSFNAMQRSFHQESGGVHYYLYTLAPPRLIILSKLIYNGLLVAGLNAVSLLFFILFFGNEVISSMDMTQFVTGLVLGSAGLGIALTFMAGLAFRSGGGIGLVSILGFPVVMPLLIALTRFSAHAIEGLSWSGNGLNLLVLVVLNIASLILSLVLFPYLWRD